MSFTNSAGAGRCGQQLTLAEAGIKSLANGGGGGGEATDHAIVADQLLENAARENTLGAVGDMELLAAQAARVIDHLGQLLSGANRRGGFQQHEIAGVEHRGNGAGCCEHIVDIGLRGFRRPRCGRGWGQQSGKRQPGLV